jgi:hypothetical protein
MLDRKLLIWQLTNRGFCSEIMTMLFAQLYCLENGIDFSLCSKYWNAAHQRGWSDYFVPFCEEISTPILRMNYLFKSGGGLNTLARQTRKALLALLTRQHVLLNYDIFGQIWDTAFVESRFSLPMLGVDGDCYAACQALLDWVWRLNNRTSASVANILASLDLADSAYFTIHVRRGDKWHEAKATELRDYMAKVDAVNHRQLRKCFVMTDDYGVVTELRREYSELDIVSLCDASERGHVQEKFNMQPAEIRRDNTLRMLAELTIAKHGTFFVGTFSSNVGRLVALLRGRESTFGADFPFTMLY